MYQGPRNNVKRYPKRSEKGARSKVKVARLLFIGGVMLNGKKFIGLSSGNAISKE